MKLHYYPETDSLYIELKGEPGVETREIAAGLVADLDAEGVVVRVDDDGGGPGLNGVTPGFGLVGMRERVQAQAGTLAIAARDGGRGLAVTARLPCEAAA